MRLGGSVLCFAFGGNIRAFGNTSEQGNRIKLPKRAQRQLRYLKRRLMTGYCCSRYTLEFVREQDARDREERLLSYRPRLVEPEAKTG